MSDTQVRDRGWKQTHPLKRICASLKSSWPVSTLDGPWCISTISILFFRCLAASCHFPDGKTNKTKQWEINKYFLELLPPKESDRINQNVMHSIHRTRTGNLKEHESTVYCSLAAGNTGLVFLRALLTKPGEKMRGPVLEKASHAKFKVQETWDSERTVPYQE